MKTGLKKHLTRLFSLVLAFILVFPTEIFAMNTDKKVSNYKESSSIMGLATKAQNPNAKEAEKIEDKEEQVKSEISKDETDEYIIEKSASLSKTTGYINFKILVKTKNTDEQIEKNQLASFAITENTDLKDLKIEEVTSIDKNGNEREEKYTQNDQSILSPDENVSTFAISLATTENGLVYYLSAKLTDQALADIDKLSPKVALEMAIISDNEKIYQNRYSLELENPQEENDITIDENGNINQNQAYLKENKDNIHLYKGIYNEERTNSSNKTLDQITWIDFINPMDDEEFAYDFNLDNNQDTTNSQIKIKYYQATDKGYVLNEDFTKTQDFTENLVMQIPEAYIAKIELETSPKKDTNAKEYIFNGTKLSNPSYKKEKEKDEEEKDSKDPDPLPDLDKKEEDINESENKSNIEEKTFKADPNTNDIVVDHSLVNDNKDLSKNQNQDKKSNSAIDLNRDSVLNKYKNEDKLSPVLEVAINNISILLNSYNDEEISYEEFISSLKSQVVDISKKNFIDIVRGLTSSLDEDTYKVAKIDIDKLAEDIFVDSKNTINEEVEKEKASSIENKQKDESYNYDIKSDDANNNDIINSTDLREENTSSEEKINKEAVENFDKTLNQINEDTKDRQDDDRGIVDSLSQGVKGIFGQSNLNKADKELKAALNQGQSLEEIQALLLDLGDRYGLDRKDEAKLMTDNEDAIKALIEKDADESFRPSMLMAQNADGISPLNNKKFNVVTSFDTSNANGTVKSGHFFNIHLDEKLKVNNPNNLKDITYNGDVIAKASYDASNNTIKYEIARDINDSISIPLNIPVDYDIENIDKEADRFTIINRISGLGVKKSQNLVPVQVDKNGNIANSITEEEKEDVVQIIEKDSGANYRFNMDAYGNPVVENGEMIGINWNIKVSSDTNLDDLGYKLNLTAVEGSGIGPIENIKVNNQDISLTDNDINGKLGIVDSKHHDLQKPTKDLSYTFYTPVTNKQSSYMLDISAALTNIDKTGAVRLVLDEGYDQQKVSEATPSRVGINNRTTIKGEFTSESTGRWTITDGVSTKDSNNGLPLESRKLNNQTLKSGQTATYGLDKYGKMVVKNAESTINSLPAKGTNPSGSQAVGNIAVYKVDTDLNNPDSAEDYSVSGVSISKYKDIYLDQLWGFPENNKFQMPEQTIKAVDNDGKELARTKVEAGNVGDIERLITIPNTKFWQISDDGTAKMIDHKIVQQFPGSLITTDGKKYEYRENLNYYSLDLKLHYTQNALVEVDEKIPATFTITKVDSNDPGKKLEGAKYKLEGANIDITTDADGKATFANIQPGEYQLIETKAPLGYKLDPDAKTIKISDDGQLSISGINAILAESNKTELVKHPSYPDYMNAMHYGKIYNNGNADFYIYLKPLSNQSGSTNKDTRLSLGIPNAQNLNVAVYDVSPNNRSTIKAAMENQNVNQEISALGNSVLGAGNNNGTISGTDNITDPYTGKTGYQITFPSGRFGSDRGYLVKVSGNIGNNETAAAYYDWLTNNNNTKNEAKIQQTTIISKESAGDVKSSNILITNERFRKSPIAITKFDDSFRTATDQESDQSTQKRNRLSGAEFVLKDSNGTTIANKYTDQNGNASFGEYPPGTYFLEELRAPAGYEKSNVYFEVNVDEIGQVTYKAKFKDGIGTPVAGKDYWIEKEQDNDHSGKAKIINVNQRMEIKEGKDSGSIGTQPGVWEAYMLESLKYHADISLDSSAPGSRFEIQFDPNLDFTQYFNEFPKINIGGKDVADPYFDYDTNLLTYVFNENSAGRKTNASIDLVGMIPSKHFAKEDGEYSFTTTVAPGVAGVGGNQVLKESFVADYGSYDTGHGNPAQSNYFREVYQADDGNWYVDVISYYNALGDKSVGVKTLKYNWLSTNYQKNQQIARWVGNGTEPAFKLKDIEIYRTYPRIRTIKFEASGNTFQKRINENMPLSYGIRPEVDNSYEAIYNLNNINPDAKITNNKSGDVTVNYDPEKIQSSGVINKSYPLTIKMPAIKNSEGYVIKQRFKVTNEEDFKKYWRTFLMTNGNLESAFTTKVNANIARADQADQEIPKFYREVVGIINEKYTPGQFKITKINELDRSKLDGAVFELIDEYGDSTYRTSDADGEVIFDNLAPGIYELEEEKAPEGFNKSDKRWKVTVYSYGEVRIEEIGIASENQVYEGNQINFEVSNKPVGEKFVIYKKDSNNNPLAGADFKLTKKGDSSFIKKASSDSNGIVKFDDNLRDGTYIIEEIKPPAGYKNLDQKWVLVIEDGQKKIYNYLDTKQEQSVKSIIAEDGVSWIDVKNRPTNGWESYDNRWSGWTGNSRDASKLGTRIVAINKDKKYVVQRYVINPEAASIGESIASIHREKPQYPNMDWYAGNEEVKVFTLDKPVTGLISDIRLANYDITDITNEVNNSHYGEPQRLKLNLPATDKPILVDIKVPYKNEYNGVGTGMDWSEGGTTYWKSDYYESVSDIQLGESTHAQVGDVKGSYVSDNSLDVTNEPKKYELNLKKVKEDDSTKGIQGAIFTLTGPDDSETSRSITSGKDGIISFKDLESGEYKLKEESPAPGYEKTNTTWTVTITKDGKVYIKDDNKAAQSNLKIESKDESSANILRQSFSTRMSMANSLYMTSPTNLGFEESPIVVPNAQGAGTDWEKLDQSRSEGRDYRSNLANNGGANVSTGQTTNGSVSANPTSQEAGKPVNLTVSPNEGYELDQLLVDNEPVTVNNNTYTFDMPKARVTVSATFKEKEPEIPEGSNEIPTDGFAVITNKQVGLDLKIIKRDFIGNKLEGAVFTLKKTDKDYNPLGDIKNLTATSAEDGSVVFKDEDGQDIRLTKGYYILEETQSPLGYKPAQAPWKIKVYEKNGQMKADYLGPEYTNQDFLQSENAKIAKLQDANNGIKYASRLNYIDTESKTFVQRLYLDTRNYTESDTVNVQIKPVIKREEIDTPGQQPETRKEGVKTAYRTTYQISQVSDNLKINQILMHYDLSNPNVSMVNTARWRPFDWGFDEDQLNLDKGVYIIDVEGYYDPKIIDKGQIELHFDLYDGERKFEQVTYDQDGNEVWYDGLDASYQAGMEAIRDQIAKTEGKEPADNWFISKPASQKYQNFLSKEASYNGEDYIAGRVWPSVKGEPISHIDTNINIKPLYESNTSHKIPSQGLEIVNEEEAYNITFSKHGRDDNDWSESGEEVTKNRLEGAIFKLQQEIGTSYEDVEGSFVGSAFNGYFGFRDLKTGRYRLMEVKAPEGYKPIKEPLLYFTVETVTSDSGKIVNPQTGELVDIKTIEIKFPGSENKYKLNDLKMIDPKTKKQVEVKDVDSKKINITEDKVINPDTNEEVDLSTVKIVAGDKEYGVGDIKIVPDSNGLISLEYDKANKVYQYVPEISTTEKDGKLVDFVTGATAKNMGKIVNEKIGELEISKYANSIDDDNKLQGAEFTLYTDAETNYMAEIDDVETRVVTDESGSAKFTNLPDGTYYLKETKSPVGYILMPTVWKINVTNSAVIIEEQTSTENYKIVPSENRKSIKLQVINKSPTYPSTGGSGTKIAFAIIGTAVMLAGLAYYGLYQHDKNLRISN